MPAEDDPSYAAWGPALVRAIAALEDGAIVVGHSVGGTILIQTLADQAPDVELAAIVLIAAPFVGEGGWPDEEFELSSDLGSRLPPGCPFTCSMGSTTTRPRRRTLTCTPARSRMRTCTCCPGAITSWETTWPTWRG